MSLNPFSGLFGGTTVKGCLVCGSSDVRAESITAVAKKVQGRTLEFRICAHCGYVSAPGNQHAYDSASSFSKGSGVTSPRVGDGERAGREFHMFRTASEILARSNLDALFFGSGLSRDYELVAKQPQVRSARVTDLDNFQNSQAFIPMTSKETFDIVIACEVVEHFSSPASEFGRLFSFLRPNGLLICSTNLADGSPIAKSAYPFLNGHVSYYSGRALAEIAKRAGVGIDLRLPECSTGKGGPRKRYAFFYREPSLAGSIVEFFGRHAYAYSEPG